MSTHDDFQVGDGVVYRPYEGAQAEDGVVVRLSSDPSLVFVRYRNQHPSAPGQATPKVRLERAR